MSTGRVLWQFDNGWGSTAYFLSMTNIILEVQHTVLIRILIKESRESDWWSTFYHAWIKKELQVYRLLSNISIAQETIWIRVESVGEIKNHTISRKYLHSIRSLWLRFWIKISSFPNVPQSVTCHSYLLVVPPLLLNLTLSPSPSKQCVFLSTSKVILQSFNCSNRLSKHVQSPSSTFQPRGLRFYWRICRCFFTSTFPTSLLQR